jgi:hypothetical protein
MKHEDTHGDVKVEDGIKINMKETDDVHGDVNVEDDIKVNTNGTCIAVDEIKGNTDNRMASGKTVSCESSGTDERGAVEVVPGEDDTTCTDADMPSVDPPVQRKKQFARTSLVMLKDHFRTSQLKLRTFKLLTTSAHRNMSSVY